jgi:arsenate reductase-like glutaredoxin family protein
MPQVTTDFLEEADINAERLDLLQNAVTAADLRRICDLAEVNADSLDRATIARLRGVIGRVLP